MTRLLLAAIFSTLLITNARGDEETERLVTDYSEKLRSTFSPVETTLQTRNLIDGTETHSVYIESGEYFLYEKPTAICAANPQYSFFLERKTAADPWQLKSLKPRTKTEHDTELVTEVQLVKGAQYGWMAANGFRIDEYFEPDQRKIRVAHSGGGDDEEVSLTIEIPDTKQWMSNGMRVNKERIAAKFLPNKYGWVPVQAEAFWPNGKGRSISQNRDFVQQDSFWIPRESETKIFKTVQQKEPYLHVLTHYDYQDTTADLDRFMVSHYGFKEPVLPGSERSRIGVVIATSFFLLVAGFLLLKKFERKPSTRSA
ncbi:hypothetical protein [Novipirellula rosea]|uniref:Uncharacterized protein n=1 Tax=Novipirellula rosea TaxID=1031540 RepID=A0ABP8MH47_9BACT